MKNEDQDFPKELIAALYTSMDKSRVDFREALSDAIELFCRHRESFTGLKKKEVKVLKRGVRNFARSSVEISGGKVPKRLPKPRRNPLAPKEQAKARA